MSILIMGACHMLVLSITCGSYSCHGLGNHVHSRHGFMSHTGVIHNMCSYSYHGWGNMSIHIMGPSHMLVLSITCGSYSYHGLGTHVHSWDGFMSHAVVQLHTKIPNTKTLFSKFTTNECHMFAFKATVWHMSCAHILVPWSPRRVFTRLNNNPYFCICQKSEFVFVAKASSKNF
jgi:hypothetical protein